MATITREGAPGKDTIGQIGDICIDSVTLRKFECVAIYTTTTNDETTVEYEWDEIHSNDTEDGSGGNTEDNSAVITELLVRTDSLENQVEEIDSTLVDVQEDILELKEASDIKETNNTIIEDTHAGVLKINEIGGVTEQFTTTGKNLLENTATTQTINGGTFTINEDKSITVNGTFTATTTFIIANQNTYIATNDSVYTLSGCPANGSDNSYCIFYQEWDSAWGDLISVTDYGDGVLMKHNDNAVYSRMSIVIANGVTCNNLTFKPMIRLASITDDTYEPYTGGIASPNPNYPQEIKKTVVTGVKTHGVQLFNKNIINAQLGISNVDGNVYFDQNLFSTDYIDVTKVDSIAWNGTSNQYGTWGAFYNANKEFVIGITASSTVLIPDGVSYVRLSFLNEFLDNLMINAGTEVLPYEPYQESVIEFSEPITLYGDPDAAVQDILNTKQVERKYGEIVLGGSDDEGWIDATTAIDGRYRYSSQINGKSDGSVIASSLEHVNYNILYNTAVDNVIALHNIHGKIQCVSTKIASIDEWKAHLSANPMTAVYELAEPVIEPLPAVDQAALSSLKTFEGVTYVEFISDIQPTFKAESSTTQEGSYVLDLLARTTSVEKQVEALDDTLLYAQEDILDLEEAFHIPEVTDTVLEGSYPGLLKINEIGGKMEQKTYTGKNMINFRRGRTTTNGGVTYTIQPDGSFKRTGTATDVVGNAWIAGGWALEPNETNVLCHLEPGVTYIVKDCVLFSNQTSYTSGTPDPTLYPNGIDITGVRNIEHEVGKTYNDTVYPMVCKAEYGEEWEPYTGGQASPNPSYPQEIKCVKGKNLLDCRGLSEATINGVTFTPVYDENGNLEYIEVNGTATDGVEYSVAGTAHLSGIDITNCILSGCPSGGSYTTYSLAYLEWDSLWESLVAVYDYGTGTTMPRNKDMEIANARIIIVSGYTADHLRFYPMIRPASVADPTYVPYGLLRIKTHGKNLASVATSGFNAVIGYVKKGKNYTICFEQDAEMGFNVIFTDFGHATIANYISIDTKAIATFTADIDSTVLINNWDNTNPRNYMLVEGTYTDFMPYEPYTESSYTFSQPIDLYGTDDVQDVITADGIDGKFVAAVFDGSDDELWQYESVSKRMLSDWLATKIKRPVYNNETINLLCSCLPNKTANETYMGDLGISVQYDNGRIYLYLGDDMTLDEWKAHLQANPMTVVYEAAEPTTEPLPLVDQIGLNNLLTYNDVTYVEFDCDGPQPTFKAEYPTSKENSYILESLLNTRSNKLNQELINNKIAALEATIVSNI